MNKLPSFNTNLHAFNIIHQRFWYHDGYTNTVCNMFYVLIHVVLVEIISYEYTEANFADELKHTCPFLQPLHYSPKQTT